MNALSVAKKLEKDASELYGRLARKTGAASLRALIADLAADHEMRYRTLQTQTGNGACDGDISQNLSRLAKHLTGRLLALQCDENRRDAETSIRAIMELESMNTEFYRELCNTAPGSAMQDLLRQLFNHEQHDCFMIEAFYEFINAPNEYLADAEFSNFDEFHQFGRQIG
jgi:rubrerythrin